MLSLQEYGLVVCIVVILTFCWAFWNLWNCLAYVWQWFWPCYHVVWRCNGVTTGSSTSSNDLQQVVHTRASVMKHNNLVLDSVAGSKLKLVWRVSPLPFFRSFSLPVLPSPLSSLPCLSLLLPSPFLRSRSPLFQRGELGERCKRSPKSNLVHFSLKIWHLTAALLACHTASGATGPLDEGSVMRCGWEGDCSYGVMLEQLYQHQSPVNYW